ncbi:MAG: hypothetical protein O2909_05320 [Chloroflexi bacterium]|nr:hypothetical protein [Chloroflexota bacterium]MDA1218845.1 hypothetical protein [Chloroflexota bacterium]PKB56896.1 MAG: hypothetical protein BZY73_06005 [SAR202 cluster bacterium Casp-Chloro-G3]
MIWLKECPKCQGDLILDQDSYGKFKTCVQCGYLRDVVETAAGLTPTAIGSDAAMLAQLAAIPIAA